MDYDLCLDIAHFPFTTRGSWLRLLRAGESGRVRIDTCRMLPTAVTGTDSYPYELFEIALIRRGKPAKYRAIVHPDRLELAAEGVSAVLAFADPFTLSFRVRGGDLRLLPCHTVPNCNQLDSRNVEIMDFRARLFERFRAAKGTTVAPKVTKTVRGVTNVYHDYPRQVTFSSSSGDTRGAVRFDLYGEDWPGDPVRVETAIRQRTAEWGAFAEKLPHVHPDYHRLALTGWYSLWSCQVDPEGAMKRRGILMGKLWMNQIWSWDNAFTAIAVAQADPELAIDQFRLFLDHQSPTGIVPDSVNNLIPWYGYTKPPIWGWALRQIVRRIGQKRAKPLLKEIYPGLSRITEYWFKHRDQDRDGLPEYHHGNDSGWDNSTAFDQGYPTAGSDLAAYLVIQLDTLADIAGMLGKPAESKAWQKRSDDLLKRMLRKLVRDGRFISPKAGTGKAEPTSSLLDRMPAVLGRKLPKALMETIVTDLQPGAGWLTDWGLATENVKSRKYTPDGYWRGPIWAPSTYLPFTGLVEAGHFGLARTIATRFCEMNQRNPGLWENFDAETGKGLRCPGYTWTSAVVVLLAEWLGMHGTEPHHPAPTPTPKHK